MTNRKEHTERRKKRAFKKEKKIQTMKEQKRPKSEQTTKMSLKYKKKNREVWRQNVMDTDTVETARCEWIQVYEAPFDPKFYKLMSVAAFVCLDICEL